MCQACDAYDEIIEILPKYDLTNDHGAQLLANLLVTFTGLDPQKTVLLLGVVNDRVLDRIIDANEETVH